MNYRCSNCRQFLGAAQFPPSALAKRNYRCLSCFREKNTIWRSTDPEKTRRLARERMRKHRARKKFIKVPALTAVDRFVEKVHFSASGCWPWIGGTDTFGDMDAKGRRRSYEKVESC